MEIKCTFLERKINYATFTKTKNFFGSYDFWKGLHRSGKFHVGFFWTCKPFKDIAHEGNYNNRFWCGAGPWTLCIERRFFIEPQGRIRRQKNFQLLESRHKSDPHEIWKFILTAVTAASHLSRLQIKNEEFLRLSCKSPLSLFISTKQNTHI